jgi:hypothetical protein
LAQAGADVVGEVAAPKPIIDLMLAEKYGWTFQEIDDIPKVRMDEMMLVLNARLETTAEVEAKKGQTGQPSLKNATSIVPGRGVVEHRVIG